MSFCHFFIPLSERRSSRAAEKKETSGALKVRVHRAAAAVVAATSRFAFSRQLRCKIHTAEAPENVSRRDSRFNQNSVHKTGKTAIIP